MNTRSVYTCIEMLVKVATALDGAVATQAQNIAIIVEPGDSPLSVYAEWRAKGGKV